MEELRYNLEQEIGFEKLIEVYNKIKVCGINSTGRHFRKQDVYVGLHTVPVTNCIVWLELMLMFCFNIPKILTQKIPLN